MTFKSGGTRNGVLISNSENQFILEGCRDNCRQDGRSRDEFRSYAIVSSDSNAIASDQHQRLQPPLVLSNGSARLLMSTGETDLVCSVRAELAHPAIDRPNSGVLEIHVDTTRKSSRNNSLDELESTLSRLLSSHLVDLDKLCISPSHYAWRLHVDLLVVASSGGSLVDACSIVIRAALRNVRLPSVSTLTRNESQSDESKPELQVDADVASAKPIPGLEKAPQIVTVTILKCKPRASSSTTSPKPTTVLIVDATMEEEACAFAKVHIALDRSKASDPTICALHKAGGGALPFNLLQDVTALAVESTVPTSTAENSHSLLQDQFLLEQ